LEAAEDAKNTFAKRLSGMLKSKIGNITNRPNLVLTNVFA
jgi:hypothetical protein